VHQDPRQQKIAIQPGIRSAKGIGREHHLRGVSQKAAPESVMIVTRRCRPPEARPELSQESLSHENTFEDRFMHHSAYRPGQGA
jgi:hypothetical protein